ncbi:MAG: hypothetical protein R3E84_23545 [Pseudomonadales bacterium]
MLKKSILDLFQQSSASPTRAKYGVFPLHFRASRPWLAYQAAFSAACSYQVAHQRQTFGKSTRRASSTALPAPPPGIFAATDQLVQVFHQQTQIREIFAYFSQFGFHAVTKTVDRPLECCQPLGEIRLVEKTARATDSSGLSGASKTS